ncbi:esterase/lipase family protein [Massilia yuzhufengensis]|uniref:Alpha/beta hydrolase family protein n=1 Tax=Massilia yuzhufengensis TaxID=1164594 RepID=A0A1I1EZN8_9BURK|nr:alpha/beta fold hydrolase [Massilia yuzhufengensis]SFB92206.1 Alpha/beta hydrolase family protein [Massilia yuzhufengensis]
MSARLMLRLILVLQALAALGIGAAAIEVFGATRWQALAAGLGSVVLVRLLINANNFFMSARFASPTPSEYQLEIGARLRMFFEEFSASMLQSSWTMPRAAACTRIHAGSGAPPVLLLHGYGCNSGYWSHLAPRLDAARISYATVDLEPLTGDIDAYAPLVEGAVDALLAATGAHKVVIVAHSMGGLVARAWMRACGIDRVARVVTLGTPHHGTCLAAFGVGLNAAQMRRAASAEPPECAWLRELARGEAAAARALVTSIYTHHDNIVSPQTSSELAGARNLAFGGVGHVALGRNPRVLDAVMREITQLCEHPEQAY